MWSSSASHRLRSLLVHSSRSAHHRAAAAVAASGVAVGGIYCYHDQHPGEQSLSKNSISDNRWSFYGNATTKLEAAHNDDSQDEPTTLLNWSGTHAVATHHFWEPESVEEVEAIVRSCHERGQPVRPVGSALSPNGIAFHPGGMISLAQLDQVVEIDTEAQTITVQAGARVSQVVEALRPHGLTLPNLASIAEQQMGGFTQVGAHGTGRAIAPVDHYVEKLVLVTPGLGRVELTRNSDDDDNNNDLLAWAAVGLGCLGVVVEVTMKCIPAHRLVEHTFVITRQEAEDYLDILLNEHKHMRYMWIPYTDAVVVVTNHPEDLYDPDHLPDTEPTHTESERLAPMLDLLQEVAPDTEVMDGWGFGELRDALLAVDPLSVDHVRRCNEAEAEFWRRSERYQIRPSDELLQFDCGGQQWVWEVCFPTGTQDHNTKQDMAFMKDLLAGIEDHQIPAHAPIEQRWSASSSSPMSPAHGPVDGLHCWVGIINYLPMIGSDTSMVPQQQQRQRQEITDLFRGPYCDLMQQVGRPYQIASHWAKLERPDTTWKLIDLRLFLQERYPVREFNQLRRLYDPKNILASPLLNLVLGNPTAEQPK